MVKEFHKILCKIEADRLKKKGYSIEFEKQLGSKEMGSCKVDVFAKKGEEIIIVECGYLDSLIRDSIIEKVGKFSWVPYIRRWCRKNY